MKLVISDERIGSEYNQVETLALDRQMTINIHDVHVLIILLILSFIKVLYLLLRTKDQESFAWQMIILLSFL